MRRVPILIAVSAFLALIAAPVSARATPGYTSADVHMRAGPEIGYPIVTIVPERAQVEIHGCLADYAWCDVSWGGYRGWIFSHYLEYFYHGRYVYLPNYFNVTHVPIVAFILGAYWHEHYAGRPWYQRRNHWENYWRTHRHPTRPSRRISPPPAPAMRAPEHRVPSMRTPARPAPYGRGAAPQPPRASSPSRRAPQTPAMRPQGGAAIPRAAPPARAGRSGNRAMSRPGARESRSHSGPSPRQRGTSRREPRRNDQGR